MRWNNNRQIGQNYRAMIRLMFAVAIIVAVIMAIFDDLRPFYKVVPHT